MSPFETNLSILCRNIVRKEKERKKKYLDAILFSLIDKHDHKGQIKKTKSPYLKKSYKAVKMTMCNPKKTKKKQLPTEEKKQQEFYDKIKKDKKLLKKIRKLLSQRKIIFSFNNNMSEKLPALRQIENVFSKFQFALNNLSLFFSVKVIEEQKKK